MKELPKFPPGIAFEPTVQLTLVPLKRDVSVNKEKNNNDKNKPKLVSVTKYVYGPNCYMSCFKKTLWSHLNAYEHIYMRTK